MARRVHKDDAHEQTAKIVSQIGLLGDEELQKRLNALDDKVIRRIVPKASKQATSSVLRTAKTLAPKESGLLIRSLGQKQKLYRRSGVFVTIVGPRTGFKQQVEVEDRFGNVKKIFRNPVKYAHLVEKGTRPHSLVPKSGLKNQIKRRIQGKNHPGSKAKEFMSRSYDANKQTVVQVYRSVIAAEIGKVAAEEAK